MICLLPELCRLSTDIPVNTQHIEIEFVMGFEFSVGVVNSGSALTSLPIVSAGGSKFLLTWILPAAAPAAPIHPRQLPNSLQSRVARRFSVMVEADQKI
jgi:hypothetical protein